MIGLSGKYALVALICITYTLADFNIKGTFDQFDDNKDGIVSEEEFRGLFNKGPIEDDDKVSITEFLTNFVKTGSDVKESLYYFFRWDVNGDLFITDEELEELFDGFDVNKDRYLDYTEHSSIMNLVLNQYQKVVSTLFSPGDDMFDYTDSNKDGALSGDEMWGVISSADNDGNSNISKAEFIRFWMSSFNETAYKSGLLFDQIAYGEDEFGSDMQKEHFFIGLDYDKSSNISRDELENGMLWLYARVNKQVDERQYMSVSGLTLNSIKLFTGLDADGDNEISFKEYMDASNKADFNDDKVLNYTELVTAHVAANFSVGASLVSFFRADRNHNDLIEQSELRMSFHQLDQNDDKVISFEEFEYSLENLKYQLNFAAMASVKILAILSKADTNDDGQLSLNEFWDKGVEADANNDLVLTRKEFVDYWPKHTGLDATISGRLFDNFDADQNGNFTSVEDVMAFHQYDYGDDGLISFEEYQNVMLYHYATITLAMELEGRMRLQGHFNLTLAFGLLDKDDSSKVSEDEWLNIHKSMDTNGDGRLSRDEYANGTKNTGLSLEGIMYVFFRSDSDHDFNLTMTELSKNFHAIDRDDDYLVSKDEYRYVWSYLLKEMGDVSAAGYNIERVFEYADTNKDRKVSKKEFNHFTEIIDSSDDDKVSREEFKKFWMVATGEPADRTEALFNEFDTDKKDGMLSSSERQQWFDNFSAGDGTLTLDELLKSLFSRIIRMQEEKAKKKNPTDNVFG